MKILRSYRWRRRLLLFGLPLLIAAPLIYLGVRLSTPGNPGNANGPTVPNYKAPTHARFTKVEQRAVHGVLAKFIRTAVAREDPASSWQLAAPSMKEGYSRKDWNRGDLPVVPYPALHKGLGQWDYVAYSYKRTVGLEVFLFPKPGSGYSALTADVELVKGRNGQWLVDYWMPKKFHGPPSLAKAKPTAKAKAVKAKATPTHRAAGKRRAAPPEPARLGTPKPSRAWWIVPIALLSLIVLVPLGILLGSWYRNRRAERDYLRAHGG